MKVLVNSEYYYVFSLFNESLLPKKPRLVFVTKTVTLFLKWRERIKKGKRKRRKNKEKR